MEHHQWQKLKNKKTEDIFPLTLIISKRILLKKYKFKNNDIHQINLFYYRSNICTGTNFMDKIQQALFNLDIGLDVEVSTLNVKGEGEMKIIHAMNDYCNQYNSFCVMESRFYMLILVALLSNNSEFNGKNLYNFRIDLSKRKSIPIFLT